MKFVLTEGQVLETTTIIQNQTIKTIAHEPANKDYVIKYISTGWDDILAHCSTKFYQSNNFAVYIFIVYKLGSILL